MLHGAIVNCIYLMYQSSSHKSWLEIFQYDRVLALYNQSLTERMQEPLHLRNIRLFRYLMYRNNSQWQIDLQNEGSWKFKVDNSALAKQKSCLLLLNNTTFSVIKEILTWFGPQEYEQKEENFPFRETVKHILYFLCLKYKTVDYFKTII